MKFDPLNPDKKLVRQVLHQAFPYGGGSGLKEVYSEAWCLRDMDVANWGVLEKHLVDNELIQESGEEQYFRITSKGEEVVSGEEY